MTTRYVPVGFTAPAAPTAPKPRRPGYRAWDYFTPDGSLKSSNPLEAARTFFLKTLTFLAAILLALPAGIYHPAWAAGGVALVALALWTSARRYGVWHGDCPHCRQEVRVGAGRHAEKEFDCSNCGGPLLLRGCRFLAR